MLKNIESTPGKPFLKSTTLANYTLKGVDRPPHFENCSAGPDGRCTRLDSSIVRAKLSFFVDSHNFFLSGVIIVNGLQLMSKICNNLFVSFVFFFGYIRLPLK